MFFLLLGQESRVYLFALWAGESLFFCRLGGGLSFGCLGGGLFFCCLGGGRVYFFAVWDVLFGLGTRVHSLTGLPGPTTKKTKPEKEKKKKKTASEMTACYHWTSARAAAYCHCPSIHIIV